MTDRPIIFSAPMIRALLDGRKTQTRRLLPAAHPQLPHHNQIRMDALAFDPAKPEAWYWDGVHDRVGASYPLRYASGDRLWLREAWRSASCYDDLAPSAMGGEEPVRYEADASWQTWGWGAPLRSHGRLRQGIHMPRWASRLTLTVTDVRVQRLQDITEADALAEGVGPVVPIEGRPDLQWVKVKEGVAAPDYAFRLLWNSIHGPDAWAANPWVCALTFTVRQGNIDT